MTLRKLAVIAATGLSVTFAPPILRHATAQNNPTVTNVIPDGGHYSVRGKLQVLDLAAGTIAVETEKSGTLPMVIGPAAEADINHVAVGDAVDVTYTRAVAFLLASPNVNVSGVDANKTVGQVAQTGIGAEATTVVGRITKVDGNHSFDVVNANGGGIYTVLVSNPARQQVVSTLKAGDSITVSVGPLIASSIAKCGVFGLGILPC
jgi:hypothetical protein